MVVCTIRDLLRLALPQGTRLLSQESGLARPIRNVFGIRATAPALPDLHGGDLIVLSMEEVRLLDETLTLSMIIVRLAKTSVGGLAVIGEVEDAAVQVASRVFLPLMYIPLPAEPRAVIREVSLLLDNPEIQLERRSAQLFSLLTGSVARGEGVEGLLKVISHVTGCATAFYDARLHLRLEINAEDVHDLLAAFHPQQSMRVYEHDYILLVRAVSEVQGEMVFVPPIGYLVLCARDIDLWDEAAAEQATAALSLEFVKQHAVEAVEVRLGGEFIHSVMRGIPSEIHILQEHATEMKYDIQRPHVAIVVAAAGVHVPFTQLWEQFERVLLIQRMNAPYVEINQTILCMFPTDKRLVAPLTMLQNLALNFSIGAGISKLTSSATDWFEASKQAEQALTLGRYLFGPQNITLFEELQVYRLLFTMRTSPELQEFYQMTLGTLIEYDQIHHTALLQTLEGYFAAQGNLTHAAEHLHIHRNTLVYRLRRISEIGGLDMEHSESMLALQVALKAHRVLKPASDVQPIEFEVRVPERTI